MRKLFPLAVAGLTLIGLAVCAPAESVSTDTAVTESATPTESVEISETETSQTDEAIEPAEATEAAATESTNPALDGSSMTSEEIILAALMGPDGEYAAALAWAEGEVLNIELYDYLLTKTDDTQLTKVLNNLRSASLDSHLPAFEAAAENGGTLDTFSSGH